MSRLTRDGTVEPVSRDQILRRTRGQGNIHFFCSADHEQDWQPYPVVLFEPAKDQPWKKGGGKDSEQIPAAANANHIEYEKKENLQCRICLSQAKTFLPGGPATSSRGQTFRATTVKIQTSLENSCTIPKWRHLIDADIQPLIFVTVTILRHSKQKKGL